MVKRAVNRELTAFWAYWSGLICLGFKLGRNLAKSLTTMEVKLRQLMVRFQKPVKLERKLQK